MSHIKLEIEVRDEHWGVAEEILVQAEVLSRCAAHQDMIYDAGGDLEDAYRLGNYRYSNQQSNYDYELECYSSRRELTDAVKEVYESCGLKECPRCGTD